MAGGRREQFDSLARLIESVLRSDWGMFSATDAARMAGYSRFHLTRIFQDATGESLSGFIRRIALERAAYRLLHSQMSLTEVGAEAGYGSTEAFLRAFQKAYHDTPARFRLLRAEWKIVSPANLHWNPDYLPDPDRPSRYLANVQFRSETKAAVWRITGNYSLLSRGWEQLARELPSIPENRTFITIYRDNMWTHPTMTDMRADIGWLLHPGEEVSPPMSAEIIPSGFYAVSDRLLLRTERNDAWSRLSGTWHRPRLVLPSFDEYPSWPLPFDQVLTRIVIGLSREKLG